MNNNQSNSASYSYENTIAQRNGAKKRHRTFRIIGIVAGVLLALVLGLAAYAFWYSATIASNLSLDSQTSEELTTVLKTPSEDTFYTLIVGKDTERNQAGGGRRSDVIILARTDPDNHIVTLVSVPRDTPYYIGDEKVKINETFAREGAAGITTAVEEVTGVPISHYIEVDFDGLIGFIDSLGGITVDIPYAFNDGIVDYAPGGQTINGAQAITIARNRSTYNDGQSQDAVRQSCDRQLVVGMINKVLELPKTEIPGAVQNLARCVSTDISLEKMLDIALSFSDSTVTVYTCTGPYEGEFDEEAGVWLCYENPQGWHDLMSIVDAGKNPETKNNTIEGL